MYPGTCNLMIALVHVMSSGVPSWRFVFTFETMGWIAAMSSK